MATGDLLDSYVCVSVQPSQRPVYKSADAPFQPERIKENLDHTCALVERAVQDHQAKLVVFPEFCVQGYQPGRSIADWERAGITLPGPETAVMAKLARSLDVHIAGAVFERIPDFPGRYFMSGFMVAPDGDTPEKQVKLIYRKVYALTHKTRPGDIYDQFVARFGRESLFPVVKTPLGRIGCAVAADIAWPEVPRTLAMKGAELIFVPTAAANNPGYGSSNEAIDQPIGPANTMVRRVRAFENSMFLAMSNIGPFQGEDSRVGREHMLTEIVDYQGRVIARADTRAETLVPAVIEMKALRAYRNNVRFNYLAQMQPQMHAPDYAAAKLCPLNDLPKPHKDEAEAVAHMEAVWRDISARGAGLV